MRSRSAAKSLDVERGGGVAKAEGVFEEAVVWLSSPVWQRENLKTDLENVKAKYNNKTYYNSIHTRSKSPQDHW